MHKLYSIRLMDSKSYMQDDFSTVAVRRQILEKFHELSRKIALHDVYDCRQGQT